MSGQRGKSRRRLGGRRTWVVLAGSMGAAAIILLALFLNAQNSPQWKPPIEISHVAAPDFTLTNQYNQAFGLGNNASGKAVAIYFGYANCPDVCPSVMLKFGAVISALGPDAAKIDLIMITTDPWRDSPKVLNTFMSRFNTRIVGLTGSVNQVSGVWRAYGVPAPDLSFPNGTKVTDPANSPGYLEDHFALIYFANANHIMSFAITPEMSTRDFVQAAKLAISGG